MRKQQGLSLIELMISITLGIVLMTGVVQMFLSSRVAFSTQQGMSRIQESGRLAMEFMARDIRMGGYMGCLDRFKAPNNRLNQNAGFLYRMEVGIEGFSGVPAGSNLIPAPLAQSDVLVVRTATGNIATLSASNDLDTVFVTNTGAVAGACSGGGTSLSGICNNDILVVSDCVKAEVFQATNVAAVGAQVEIDHAAAGVPGNAFPVWGGAIVDPEFAPGAEVAVAQTIAYYIAINGNGQPGLYQNINGANPSLELLEGVEDMRLLFSRSITPAVYQTAAEIVAGGGWDNVDNPIVSVRIELLVRSIEDNILEESQSFVFPAGTAARLPNPVDRRMRQVFTNTVGVRSSLP